jgi:hypothetical protein
MEHRLKDFKNLQIKARTTSKVRFRSTKSDEEFYELVGKISGLMAPLSPPDKLKVLRVLAFGENQFAGSLCFPTPKQGEGVMPCTSTSLAAARQITVPKRSVKRSKLAKPLRTNDEYVRLANTLKRVKKDIRARKADLKEKGTDPSTDVRLQTLVEESHTAVRRKQALRNELGVKPGPKCKQKDPSSLRDVETTIAETVFSEDDRMIYDQSVYRRDTPRGPAATGVNANPFAGSKRGKASDGTQPERSSRTRREGSD